MTLLSPGSETTEVKPSVVTIAGASVSNFAVIGVTVKGPIGIRTLVTSWEQFVEKFGGFTPDGWVAYAVWAIYKRKPGARVYVIRTVHYSDITAGTHAALASTVTLKDRAAVTPVDTLKVSAINEGKWGDSLKIKITDDTQAGSGRFILQVIETVSGTDYIRETFKGLSLDETDSVNFVEFKINGKSKYVVVEDLNSATASPLNVPAIVANGTTLAGGNDGLTSITDVDFVGDEGQRSGIYALNTTDELVAFCVPGKTTSTVQKAAFDYCAARGDRYFVADPAFGLDRDGIIDQVDTLAVNNDFGEINWPNVAITDPLTGLRKVVPNSGFILGAMAATFDNQDKGPWKVAAGIDDGQLAGVIGLETENHEVNDQGTRDAIYPLGINPIFIKTLPTGSVLCRYGARTQAKTDDKKLYINERWSFLYAEKSIKDGTEFERFENIDTNLMKKAERAIKSFLLNMWKAGGLKGEKPEEAFYVKVDVENNPESEQRQGKLRHKIGLATHTPNEFSYFEFERDNRALEAELG